MKTGRFNAQFVTFAGVMTALSVLLALAANAMGQGNLFLPVLMAVTLCAAVAKKGMACGGAVYALALVLTVFLTGNVLLAVEYGAFFGLYPLLKYVIEDRVQSRALRFCLKGIYFAAVSALVCLFIRSVTWLTALFDSVPAGVLLWALGAGLTVCMMIYDVILTYCIAAVMRVLNRIWRNS